MNTLGNRQSWKLTLCKRFCGDVCFYKVGGFLSGFGNQASALVRWRRQWHPTPVLLSGKSHGRRSLEGCSPWGRWGSDTTERLHFHLSLSCIGEGNGNPLQCSCLENPRDGGAWWAAVCGAAQSRTRLKWLSSSCRPGQKFSSLYFALAQGSVWQFALFHAHFFSFPAYQIRSY